ncbi:MAG: phage replisome organizer N-terminal domain-containing protein [Candidatus Eisenbacteria bacterium]|nr:phage replisome organizer N-terminal domain-containing protein [Candidatus Eisenbacteria bacterium]
MADIPHPERLRRSRPWFKVWARHTLYGTTFSELDAGPRAVWFSLLCMACDSPEPGVIGLGAPITVGYTNEQLSDILKLDEDIVSNGLHMLQQYGKVSISVTGVITITKWNLYQSDYDRTRQAPSRTRKRTAKSTLKSTSHTPPSEAEVTEVTEVTEDQRIRSREDGANGSKTHRSLPLSKLSDDDWFAELKKTYTWLDVDREMAKARAWILTHNGRQFTRRFFVNWLNKVEKPIQQSEGPSPLRTMAEAAHAHVEAGGKLP